MSVSIYVVMSFYCYYVETEMSGLDTVTEICFPIRAGGGGRDFSNGGRGGEYSHIMIMIMIHPIKPNLLIPF